MKFRIYIAIRDINTKFHTLNLYRKKVMLPALVYFTVNVLTDKYNALFYYNGSV